MSAQIRRRGFLAGLAGIAAVAGTAVALPQAGAAADDRVNMEKLVLAAQLDPVKNGTGVTDGAAASVRLIEQALRAEGLLASKYVDGHFGTVTRSAYVQWQKSLGYRGVAANGMPGRASLTELGKGRFTVTRVITPGVRTEHQGWPFNARTLAMLKEAERLSGLRFTVEQGSYSPGADPTSAGTHDGGGAADLDAEKLTAKQRTAAVKALRKVGFAAWLRTPSQGDWPLHIHAVAVNDTDLAKQAQDQVGKYYLGRNGLADNKPDDGPQVPKVTWEDYRRATR